MADGSNRRRYTVSAVHYRIVSDAADTDDGSLESIVAGAVTMLTMTVAFGLLALGISGFWIAFPVGFGGVLPLAVTLARRYESDDDSSDPDTRETDDDALDALRARYARGEIGEAEFERRVERLLETERADDARAPNDGRLGRDGDRTDRERGRSTERE